MNYKKIYDSIISNRRIDELFKTKEQYTERHHIIPVSLGGLEGSNVLRVSGREHFILHALLVRIYEKTDKGKYEKMICAFNNMKANPDGCNRYFNSRLFEKYKKEYSRIVSERQTGEGNSQFGTMWITNESLEENKKILKDELIPNGWKKGKCNYKLKNENIIKFTNLTKLYNESELDWEEFKKENDIKSNLINFKVLVRKYSNMVILKKKNICKEDINYYKTLYKIFEKNTFNEFVNITGYDKEYNTLKYHFKKILKINISDKLLFTNDKNKEKRKEELKNLYQKYKDNDWENFINISGYDKTRKNLLRMFRRYNII